MPQLTAAPILEEDWSNQREVLSAISAMVLGDSAVVVEVVVQITERLPDGSEHCTELAGPVA